MGLGKIFNKKALISFVIIILVGYLASKFPDEAIVFGGIGIIIIIWLWILQAEKENG